MNTGIYFNYIDILGMITEIISLKQFLPFTRPSRT